jgi:YgiT-type zinc finger domain-containing protein
MKCMICKHGETQPGFTTVTFSDDNLTLVIKGVPAQVCDNCGEAYVDEAIAAELLRQAEESAKTGVQVDVRHYIAA